jgi:hypothetical protein
VPSAPHRRRIHRATLRRLPRRVALNMAAPERRPLAEAKHEFRIA